MANEVCVTLWLERLACVSSRNRIDFLVQGRLEMRILLGCVFLACFSTVMVCLQSEFLLADSFATLLISFLIVQVWRSLVSVISASSTIWRNAVNFIRNTTLNGIDHSQVMLDPWSVIVRIIHQVSSLHHRPSVNIVNRDQEDAWYESCRWYFLRRIFFQFSICVSRWVYVMLYTPTND